jgi:hypothetical protein
MCVPQTIVLLLSKKSSSSNARLIRGLSMNTAVGKSVGHSK